MKTIHIYQILFLALLLTSCDNKEEIPREFIGNWQMEEHVKEYIDYDVVDVYPLCKESTSTGTVRCENLFWSINQDGTIDRSSVWTIDGEEGNTVEHPKLFYEVKGGVIDINSFAQSFDGTINISSNKMTLSGDQFKPGLFSRGITIPSDITFRRAN